MHYVLAALLLVASSYPFSITHAMTADTVPFTKETWFTLPHPNVAEFAVTITGEAYGTLEDGRSFRQIDVPNELGIRVQRFEIDDHFHFIVEGVPIYSLAALSVELAHAYHAKTV